MSAFIQLNGFLNDEQYIIEDLQYYDTSETYINDIDNYNYGNEENDSLEETELDEYNLP